MKGSYHGVLVSLLFQPVLSRSQRTYILLHIRKTPKGSLVHFKHSYIVRRFVRSEKNPTFVSSYGFQGSFFLYVHSDLYLVTFVFCPKNFLYHFLDTSLIMINSFSFHMSERGFVLSSS